MFWGDGISSSDFFFPLSLTFYCFIKLFLVFNTAREETSAYRICLRVCEHVCDRTSAFVRVYAYESREGSLKETRVAFSIIWVHVSLLLLEMRLQFY